MSIELHQSEPRKRLKKTKIQNTNIDREGRKVFPNPSKHKQHAARAYRHRKVVCYQFFM